MIHLGFTTLLCSCDAGMLNYEQISALLRFFCVYLTPAPRTVADVEVLLLVDLWDWPCSSCWLVMQLLVTDSTAQFPFGTVLEDLVVFLVGWKNCGVLPVLPVLKLWLCLPYELVDGMVKLYLCATLILAPFVLLWSTAMQSLGSSPLAWCAVVHAA
jgi:hypothetical protein